MRLRQKRGEAGTTKRRLAKLLQEAGFEVDPGDLRRNYNTCKLYDEYAWEGYCKRNGMITIIASWDTMSECVKHGIEVWEDGSGFEVGRKG